LRGTGLTIGAGLLGCGAAPRVADPAAPATPGAPSGPAPLDVSSWQAIRRHFDLTDELIHLGGFFLASHPTPVRDAIERHRKALDLNPFGYVEDNVGPLEIAARAAAASYLGVEPDDFAMTDSTTMGLALIYNGIELKPEQEILTSEHDHPATIWSLRYRASRTGAKVRTIQLYEDSATTSEEAIVSAVTRAIKPETRMVALTWVHSTTGVKTPVARIADALAIVNRGRANDDRVLLSIDGVHGFGIEDVTIADLRCDFFIAGCHKWLFGPRGTGIVWGRSSAWPAVTPTIPTFEVMWRTGPRDKFPIAAQMTPGGFHSFEHRWALPAAFEFHAAIGKARVATRIHELNRQCKAGLAAMKHVRLYTPASDALSAGLVCFDVDHLPPSAVIERLKAKKILASESPYAFKCARLAPSLLTSPEQIEVALREIRALA